MAFGVFIHRADSAYKDVPSERYQFPKQYLSCVKQCVGDWIVYLEPRRAKKTRGYFAVAKVQEIIPDPESDMFIAVMEKGTYLDFGDPVKFNDDGFVVEQGLLNDQGQMSGRKQAAVRTLSPADFDRIVERGLGQDDPVPPRTDEPVERDVFEDPRTSFENPPPRGGVGQITNRVIRKSSFRKAVLQAYGQCCAITGLRLINGGGRAEAEAAHIRPVKHDGPDMVCNGIALSGTAHWMFDRGLVGLSDDLDILVSRQSNDPETVRSMINDTGKLIFPSAIREVERPRREFVEWHRTNCFKQ